MRAASFVLTLLSSSNVDAETAAAANILMGVRRLVRQQLALANDVRQQVWALQSEPSIKLSGAAYNLMWALYFFDLEAPCENAFMICETGANPRSITAGTDAAFKRMLHDCALHKVVSQSKERKDVKAGGESRTARRATLALINSGAKLPEYLLYMT